jgi:AP-1 complex subunit beta-1
VWIIGEYADRIDNAPELIDTFCENFLDEDEEIQQQILTAV